MGDPQISVLLPVHNGERFVGAAIESVLSQDFSNFEFIIVDDGSEDGTDKIIESYVKADNRIRHVRAGRIGLVASLEMGRGLARGALIARMDADDIALASRFRLQKSFLDSHPGVVAVGGQIEKINEQGDFVGKGRYPITIEACRAYLFIGSPFCHPAVMMRADALAACGGYRQKYAAAEDYDLWQRLAAGGDLANLPDVLLRYRVHANNLTIKNAQANAAAAALSLLEAKGEDVGPLFDQRSAAATFPAMTEMLNTLPEGGRDQFLRHYIRFLTLNGGINDVPEGYLSLLKSYANLEAVSDDEVAFTLVRAVKILAMKKRFKDAGWAFLIGVRRCPMRVFVQVFHLLSRAMKT